MLMVHYYWSVGCLNCKYTHNHALQGKLFLKDLWLQSHWSIINLTLDMKPYSSWLSLLNHSLNKFSQLLPALETSSSKSVCMTLARKAFWKLQKSPPDIQGPETDVRVCLSRGLLVEAGLFCACLRGMKSEVRSRFQKPHLLHMLPDTFKVAKPEAKLKRLLNNLRSISAVGQILFLLRTGCAFWVFSSEVG